MRFSISHDMHYGYDSPVRLSTQYLRLYPRDTARQKVLRWKLETLGNPMRTQDGYGNVLHVLTLDKPVSEISIHAEGVVETTPSLDEPSDFRGTPLSPLLFLRQTGLTRATGVNLVAKERWNFGASTEIGKLRDSQTAATTGRRAAGIRMGYGRDKIQFSSGVEYRRDIAEQLDTTHTKRIAWLFRNNFKLQLTPDWRMIGKLDRSVSDSSLGAFYGGGYTEAVVGYAYRPLRLDRLSALAKYTYFYNIPTTDQVTMQNTAVEFIQKSHIAALDLTYDVTANWSVGGKYAYRLGEASLDRTQLNFFDNAAQLSVLRVDRRFRKNWDSMAEVRMLTLPDIRQRRRGALAAAEAQRPAAPGAGARPAHRRRRGPAVRGVGLRCRW